MRFELGQKHIDAGIREDCHNCPAALAIVEKLPGVDVRVTSTYMILAGGDRPSCRVLLPWCLTCWICDFDAAGEMEPFAFDLDIPAEFLPDGEEEGRCDSN